MTRGRVVVKVGSNVLTRDDGMLDVTRVSSIVDQLVWLRSQGYEVALVSSGAVASGRGAIHTSHPLDSVEQRQLFSAIGQVKLINLYHDLFRNYGVCIGQVLTMKESFVPGKQYDNQKSCINVMLAHGVMPIVNENDTVCVTELMFTDNDELSALVATMIDARLLVILTNVDGIYTGAPAAAGSELVRRVTAGDDVERFVTADKSAAGRGGMRSKVASARALVAEGRRVVIANGRGDTILRDIITGRRQARYTEFV